MRRSELMQRVWEATGAEMPDEIRILLLALASLADENGRGTAGQQEIADVCGCACRTVRRRLRNLDVGAFPVQVRRVHRLSKSNRGRDTDLWELVITGEDMSKSDDKAKFADLDLEFDSAPESEQPDDEEIHWVRLSDMSVDQSYQRELDERRARKIAKEFQSQMRGLFVLSDRDSRLWIVDGQHRWFAMSQVLGMDSLVPCSIYRGLTRKQESDLFLAHQGSSKKVPEFDKFRAKKVAERTDALEIQRTVEKFKLHVRRGSNRYSVSAVTGLNYAHKKGNLEETLRVLTGWSEYQNNSFYDRTLLKGMSLFIATYPEADLASLIPKLRKAGGAARVLRDIQDLPTGTHIRTVQDASVATFVHLYNERRPRSKCLVWPKL